MSYLYSANLDSLDRRDQLEIQLDDGTTAILRRGHLYDLTTGELARARRYAVLVFSATPADERPIAIIRLPVKGNPAEGQVPSWNAGEGVFVPMNFSGGQALGTLQAPNGHYYQVSVNNSGQLITTDIGVGPVDDGTDISAVFGHTVDGFNLFRIIMFDNGTVRAIPATAVPPATPTGLATDAKLSSVRVTWNAVTGATSYRVYRDGSFIKSVTSPSYRDLAITSGSTYNYRVQAVDVYGQRSQLTSQVSAFINPALNVAPVVTVKAWPASAPSNGRTYLRVNAFDANAQSLALTLGVSAGTIAPTADSSVWIYTP